MSLTKVQTIGIETGISFTGVTTITSLNATQGANISISSPGVALTITQSGPGGYVQVGTSSTVAVIDNSGRFLVGVASTTSDSRAVFQGSSASATGGTNVYLQRGSTPTSGDKLGLFAFSDVHGKVGAEISAYADATWSLNDYPGRLVFSTTPDGSSTVTERLRIDDSGNLILDSDLDTYIHHPAADTLAVTTGGSERLRITSTGALNFVGAGTAGSTQAVSFNGSAPVNSLVIDSSGRLGIGSSSPGRNLTVQNSSTIVAASLVSNPANIAYLLFGDTDSDAQGRVQYDNSSDSLQFYSSGSERVRIDSSGRLGIGTSSPSTTLSVAGGISGTAGANISGAGWGVLPYVANSLVIDNNAGEARFFATGANATTRGSFIFYNGETDGGAGAAMVIDSSSRVGIGTTSPATDVLLTVGGNDTDSGIMLARSSGNDCAIHNVGGELLFKNGSSSTVGGLTERARIDSSGRLLVGTSTSVPVLSSLTGAAVQVNSNNHGAYAQTWFYGANNQSGAAIMLAKSRNTTYGSYTAVQSGDSLGGLYWAGDDGSDLNNQAASILCWVDGTPGTDDMPGRLVFSTTADGASSPTARMLILNTGELRLGSANQTAVSTDPCHTIGGVSLETVQTNLARLVIQDRANNWISFKNGAGTHYGTISINGAGVTYGSNSDYRLKENVSVISQPTEKLKLLKPCQYSFIAIPDQRVDGFLAHELQEVVPSAVNGTKDAINADGDPEYQTVDASKLVPLLTAALQEAVAKIESLEARLTAAGI